ncbi:MAG: hypothetical protein M3O09_09055 [Acidobacteriota bacterium]|nr:hypothetical protein [Acidobacteriota bacterium]
MSSDWPFFDFPKLSVDLSRDVIYLLSHELRIVYCNPAWDKFALENQGTAARCQNVSGTELLHYIAEDLQPTYLRAFASARTSGRSELTFECSSPSHYRHYRMRIRLLRAGYAITNSLQVERPHNREIFQPDYAHFENGTITSCVGCRRTKNLRTRDAWDWVPYFLKDSFVPTNHRLCPACSVYYRSAVSAEDRQQLAS